MSNPADLQGRHRWFQSPVFMLGWLPLVIGILLSISMVPIGWEPWRNIASLVAALILPYYLIMAIVCAFKRRWRMVGLGLVAALVLAATLFACVALVVVQAMLGPPEDGFADNLSLPENVELAEPKKKTLAHFQIQGGIEPSDASTDPFQDALMESLKTPASDSASLTAQVSNLESLATNHSNLLLRYLAARPEWRVFRERGVQYATRRWKIGGEWLYELHGYYTDHDIHGAAEQFQSRFTIGLEGKPWAPMRGDVTKLRNGQTATVALSKGNGNDESRCVISAGPVVLEIFEQSIGLERRLTKAAIKQFESELAPLANSPTEETLQTLLPEDERRTGAPDLILSNGMQGGIYDGEVWCNPGESGMIYLRAFEITTGQRLSQGRLDDKSSERVNWSNDPHELFLAKTNFTIYEGDWGQYYGARFEIWFVPDSGKQERKLFEKNYKIEGWMR